MQEDTDCTDGVIVYYKFTILESLSSKAINQLVNKNEQGYAGRKISVALFLCMFNLSI